MNSTTWYRHKNIASSFNFINTHFHLCIIVFGEDSVKKCLYLFLP
jgi:hypothetical protein